MGLMSASILLSSSILDGDKIFCAVIFVRIGAGICDGGVGPPIPITTYDRTNKRAYAQCQKFEATEWDVLGARVMERIVGGPINEPVNYQQHILLNNALEYFNKSIAVDNECIQPHINLGLVLFAMNKFDEALKEWDFVSN
jgi:tetratricopeptide (TPR) repeat protein